MSWTMAQDGARIHYSEWGEPDGEVVLFLHGLGTDNLGWIRQRRAFGHRYRCIAVDNRGSGRSDKPEGPYTLAMLTCLFLQSVTYDGMLDVLVVYEKSAPLCWSSALIGHVAPVYLP